MNLKRSEQQMADDDGAQSSHVDTSRLASIAHCLSQF